MKKFNFKYSKSVYVLLWLVIALSLISIGWNIYNLISKNTYTSNAIAGSIFICIIAFIIGAFATLVLINSKYIIEKDKLISLFGVIKLKRDINDIISLIEFRTTHKLVIYFKDKTYTVAIIKQEDYDGFIEALRAVNHEIRYDKDDEEENKL